MGGSGTDTEIFTLPLASWKIARREPKGGRDEATARNGGEGTVEKFTITGAS